MVGRAGLGADPRELQRVAAHLDDHARELEADLARSRAEAEATWWQGQDADRFRARLDGEHADAGARTVAAVHQAASGLRHEADEQARAADT